MNIWAVCKTFRGEEFAQASLESIYEHVSGILYVHQDIGWTGKEGNTVRPIVSKVADPKKKIHHIVIKEKSSQNDQYNEAIAWLQAMKEKIDYVQLIDTDEVFDEKTWPMIKSELVKNEQRDKPFAALRCHMYSYIKSPFFRIYPEEPLCPIIMVRWAEIKKDVIDCRGSTIEPSATMDGVYFHHFCSVRKSLSVVWEKHESSCGIENEPVVPKDEWVRTVWNKLPDAENLLPLQRYRSAWREVKPVPISDLPLPAQSMDLVKAWLGYPINPRIRSEVDALLLLKYGFPLDFGPKHPDWNIPSKRNKYNAIRSGLAI
jgi:hypothetical protein